MHDPPLRILEHVLGDACAVCAVRHTRQKGRNDSLFAGACADSYALRGNAGVCGVQVFFCNVYDTPAFRGHSFCTADHSKQMKNCIFRKEKLFKIYY